MTVHEASLDLPPDVHALLARYGFDAERFERLRARWKAADGDATKLNALRGEMHPLPAGMVRGLPAQDSEAARALRDVAFRAISKGQVGIIVLAGGMATRFGGLVKALVEVLPGRTFLDLKLSETARVGREANGHIPALVMTSFATHEAIAAHLRAGTHWATPFPQFVSLRLTEEGALFLGTDGSPSPYATGHGDLPFALRGALSRPKLLPPSVEYVFVSNVDNLGATLDPLVLGAHLRALTDGRDVSVEVVDKVPGDQGGIPAEVNGTPQIVEAFRIPPGFVPERVPVFNTNTFVFRLAALLALPEPALDWFAVRKQVEGRPAVQFERLLGQATAVLPTAFLRVPRDGPSSRFVPIKAQRDMWAAREWIRTRWPPTASSP